MRSVYSMSRKRYELIYEYVHCSGISTHVAGVVDTEDEARTLVDLKNAARDGGECAAETDPTDCGVSLCPLKRSVPRYGFREVKY